MRIKFLERIKNSFLYRTNFNYYINKFIFKIKSDSKLLHIPQTRIAFVKQDVLDSLYCCSKESSPEEMLNSSMKHSGPIALFTKFNTDFFILKSESTTECRIWQQKVIDCAHEDLAYFERLKTMPYLDGRQGHTQSPGSFSLDVKTIDWAAYDVVISIDISIPTEIVKRNKSVIWAYMISEPCMGAYSESNSRMLAGYDLFFNQRMNATYSLTKKKYHEVDFPYNFQYYGCFHEIFKRKKNDLNRTGIFIEPHSNSILNQKQRNELSNYGSLKFVQPKTENILKDLLKCKYFVHFGGVRSLWGNSMIEAIASGCLFIGNPNFFKDQFLFTRKTRVSSYTQLLKRLEYFENNNKVFKKELSKQRNLLYYFCYARPLSALLSKIQKLKTLKLKH